MSYSTHALIAGMSGFFVGAMLLALQWYDAAIFCLSISGALVGGSLPEKNSKRIILGIGGFLLGGAMAFVIAEMFGIDASLLLVK